MRGSPIIARTRRISRTSLTVAIIAAVEIDVGAAVKHWRAWVRVVVIAGTCAFGDVQALRAAEFNSAGAPPRMEVDRWSAPLKTDDNLLCGYTSVDFNTVDGPWKNKLENFFSISMGYKCTGEAGESIITGIKQFLINCRDSSYHYYSSYTDKRPPWRGLMETHDFDRIETLGKSISEITAPADRQPKNFYLASQYHIENSFRWFCR